MLDYAALAAGLDEWAQYHAEQAARLRAALQAARRALRGADREAMAKKARASRTSWLLATPLEAPGQAHPAPPAPDEYAALATDGSQIAPDRQEVASCFLLNVGWVRLRYGPQAAAALGNAPRVVFRAEEMVTDYGDRQVPVDAKALADRRRLLEADRLGELLSDTSPLALAMVDGSLIWWQLQADSEHYRAQMVAAYLRLFEQARAVGIPVIGYISDPAGREVANTLRLLACPEPAPDCDRCPFPQEQRPCREGDLPMVADAPLFAGLLRPGERSAVFESDSPVLSRYGEHHICFCYLHVGQEMARLELPGWCARDPGLLALAHALALDQAGKGRGYPVALAEAHEQAVVRAADREVFYRMLESRLVGMQLPARRSAKQIAKRGGSL